MDVAAAATAAAAAATTITGTTGGMDAPATCTATGGTATGASCTATARISRGPGTATSQTGPTTDCLWVRHPLPTFECTNVSLNSSNNPFAAVSSPAPPPVPSPQQPAQSSLSSFSLPSTYESHTPPPRQNYSPSPRPAPAPSPKSTPVRGPTRTDQEHAHLADLFAARDGDGIDTFGNIGALRYVMLSYYIFGPTWLTDAMSTATATQNTENSLHKRQVLNHHRAASILSLHSSSNSNRHRITSSLSSPSENRARYSSGSPNLCFSPL